MNTKSMRDNIPLATRYALSTFILSMIFLFAGVLILLETGISKTIILQGFGLALVICGLGCAGCLLPGVVEIMNK